MYLNGAGFIDERQETRFCGCEEANYAELCRRESKVIPAIGARKADSGASDSAVNHAYFYRRLNKHWARYICRHLRIFAPLFC
jgi:hypothetical protein